MDAEEISRWVLFVTRLVRAAERLAAESKPASPVSPSFMSREDALQKQQWKKQSEKYERLFNLMDMPRSEREDWIQKYVLYNPEEAYPLPDLGGTDQPRPV